MDQEEIKKPADKSELLADIERNEKVVPDLFQTIVAEEELMKKDVSFKETLITLVDDYLQQRAETLTQEQRNQLASLRGKIIITLTDF